MPYAHPKSVVHSFRFRLMMWNAGIVLVSALVTGLGLRFGVEYALVREVDSILLKDLREIELAVPNSKYPQSAELYEFLQLKAAAHDLDGWYVRVMDSDGKQLWASPGAPVKTPLLAEQRYWHPFTLGEFRLVQAEIFVPSDATPPLVVRIGTPLQSIRRDLHRLDGQVLFVVLIVLVAAPLFGYGLASQMTRPLADLTRSAERMRPDRLEERLPIRKTGDELDQLSHTVNRLLDRIARHLDQKRDFLANAAHELRTPLAAIRSSVEVAMGSAQSEDEYRELLEQLIDQCESLEILVNQLLLLAESDADRLRMYNEPLSLSEVVRKSVEIFEPVAEYHAVRMTVEVQPEVIVEGNRHHLRQVMNNLLDNAIKYTSQGGTIRVRLERHPAARNAVIEVSDSGIGIKEEDVSRVFERFFRSDRSRQRDVGTRGTGLGLSICKAIVESHDGTIKLTSEQGQGTHVFVTLPLAPQDEFGDRVPSGDTASNVRSS